MRTASALLVSGLLVFVACGSAGTDAAAPPAGGGGSSAAAGGGEQSGDGGDGAGGGGQVIGAAGSGGSLVLPSNKTAKLTGVVRAPEGTIPIAGALVYLTDSDPPPIPEKVFCDTCVSVKADTPYALAAADGKFSIDAAPGSYKLVVQKGAFRRVRPITLVDGPQEAPEEATRFPGAMNKAGGDDIPRMVVTTGGAWDRIDQTLKKLGLSDLKVQQDKLQFPPDPNDPDTAYGLLHNYDNLSKYHVVFIPCQGTTTCDGNYQAAEGTVKANLQRFVAEGGKLYTTDYMYDYVTQPFPGYLDLAEGPQEETESSKSKGDPGYACQMGSWSGPATVQDQGLGGWLTALGFASFDLYKSYTVINSTASQQGLGADGQPTTVTPRVWMLGNGKPATVSWEHGCGRALFSTYHTEDKAVEEGVPKLKDLLPQELALLYIILQVNVCVGSDTGVVEIK